MNFFRPRTLEDLANVLLITLLITLSIQIFVNVNRYLLFISVCILIWISKHKLFCLVIILVVYSFKFDLIMFNPNKVNFGNEIVTSDLQNMDKPALDNKDESIENELAKKTPQTKKQKTLTLVLSDDITTVESLDGTKLKIEETEIKTE
ncbi:uncharacterized protein VNE69_10018 [Vairimorpha necatrix]|uniref:Uncharacterized protein n=1 Tax=Vairimorpha necatrix TaxID=6039 RepID=A0AAX4JFJ3_9MICR